MFRDGIHAEYEKHLVVSQVTHGTDIELVGSVEKWKARKWFRDFRHYKIFWVRMPSQSEVPESCSLSRTHPLSCHGHNLGTHPVFWLCNSN